MDKVFSARVDEKTVKKIDTLAHKMHSSKKKVIEEAIECYANQVAKNLDSDIIAESSGAWSRGETPAATVKKAKKAFSDSMKHNQRKKK